MGLFRHNKEALNGNNHNKDEDFDLMDMFNENAGSEQEQVATQEPVNDAPDQTEDSSLVEEVISEMEELKETDEDESYKVVNTNDTIVTGQDERSNEETTEIKKWVRELNAYFVSSGNKHFKIDTSGRGQTEVTARTENEINEVLKEAKIFLTEKKVNPDIIPNILVRFRQNRWGYWVLEPLLTDPDISDIAIFRWDYITIKKLGKRYKTDVKFSNLGDYMEFVSAILTRNGIGQSENNACVKFTDVASNPLFRMRFDIMTKYVMDSTPYVHIRLETKKKKDLDDLEQRGMFPAGTRDFLVDRIKAGDGMLFVGRNGSGKTSLLNALLDTFDSQKKIQVIEDNQELFSEDKEREIFFTHSVESRNTNKITYGMSDLAEVGLLSDIDVMIIGEVKNDSAKGIMKAAYVGTQPFTTSHGNNAVEGYRKLADYVKQATTYDLNDCLQYLVGFKILVFMKGFKIHQIVRNNGWIESEQRMSFTTIFDADRGGWIRRYWTFNYSISNAFSGLNENRTYTAVISNNVYAVLKQFDDYKNGKASEGFSPYEMYERFGEGLGNLQRRIENELKAFLKNASDEDDVIDDAGFEGVGTSDYESVIKIEWPWG